MVGAKVLEHERTFEGGWKHRLSRAQLEYARARERRDLEAMRYVLPQSMTLRMLMPKPDPPNKADSYQLGLCTQKRKEVTEVAATRGLRKS